MTKPDSTPTILYPSLFYDDAVVAIDWLCRAFGFRKRLVVPGAGDTVMHSELTFGPAVIMVASAKPEMGWASPRGLPAISSALSLHVENPDAHFARAKAAGAVVLRELRDEEYGGRGYMVRDPEGHQWYFGSYRPGAHWNE
ncbi:MAG: VOC family protein [Steroidobacteraceae bacterium]